MDKLSVTERLKNLKHKEIIAGGAVLVIVLAIYFSIVSCTGSAAKTNDTFMDISGSSSDYCTVMQKRVENIVSEISGVGSASVVINWDRSTSANGFANTADENPKATGALIVCDGGNSTKVKLDVMFAVSTLLDLSIEKIIVYPKNQKS